MTNSFSAGHEREECRKMNRGFWHSLFGILFCIIPGLGLLLAISGFIRQAVRITRKHRIRNVVFTVFALISLITCVSALAVEAYEYSRNPMIVEEFAHAAWEAVTGQKEFPWETDSGGGGTNYGYSDSPGLGQFDENEHLPHSGDEGEEIDLSSLPDLETMMDEIRHPFAQYGL